MAEIKNNLFELYSEKVAPRKTLEQLHKNDPEAASKQLAKSKEFAIKMMLANAKNTDPFAENDNKATEMLQTANLIAQLDSASAQVQEMQKMAEAVKNPGYNALDLHGKEVSYDNSKHLFDGKSPVNFSYNINHPEDENTSNVTATINIKDGAGNVVYTHQEFNVKKGEHNFVWDGISSERKKLALGVYSIDVVAAGKKTINGVQTSFKVDAKSFLSGVVESVEIQNGQATRLILENGRSITKDQVISSGSVKSDKSLVELSPDLIYKHVELDLSKAQANSSGQLKVYYNNNVASPGKMLTPLQKIS